MGLTKMFEVITNRLPDNLTEVAEKNNMSLQAGFITGSLCYTAGINYVYRQKMDGLKIVRKLPGGLAGGLVGLTLTGVGVGSAYCFSRLVEQPLGNKELDCSSCSLTRGAGVTAGFTGAGMLGVTSIYAHHFQPNMGPISLSVHSFNFHCRSAYGCLFLLIGGFTGLDLARKLNRDH